MTERCPHCDQELTHQGLLCPHCGATLSPPAKHAEVKSRAKLQPQSRAKSSSKARKPIWRRLLLLLLSLLVFIGAVSGAAYAGLYFGERDRETQRLAVVQEHYDAGLQALNDGRFERAVAEFEYVTQLDPGHTLAAQGIMEARARLAVKPTPTLEVVESLTEQLLEQARVSYAEEDWAATANTLTQLRALDLEYAQEDVEAMLFESLYNAGIQFLEQDSLEVGISYLDQAIALRPLDAEAVNRRNLAARYLDALNYWGVDWELCIERFEALNASAPMYKDVTQRLYQAYLAYAEYFVQQGEMCPAEMQYTQALRMFVDPQIDQKRAEAAQTCLIATPAPLNGVTPHLTPQPIIGFSMGRLAYPVYNEGTGFFDLYALYADGRILQVATNADQPWWEWGTGRVVYRDRMGGGINMILPEEGVPLQLLGPAGQAWPTLSLDAQRIAYAAPDTDGIWYIYVTSTTGGGTPARLGQGWAPAWGAGGMLAYTGCDAEGVCGIMLDNPDDDQAATRLTGNENDMAVSWAPGGNLMAYMSNVTGNWDILLLNPQGGVQPLTSETSDEGLPVWSPDGSQLAFVSNQGGNWAVYVMQIDGQNVHRILDLGTTFPGWENQRLSWSH